VTDRPTLDRVVTDWLHADATSAGSNHVLAAALVRVSTIGQERTPRLPRFADMNTYAKLALGAAAVLAVAIVGINLLPGRNGGVGGGGGGGPTPSPSPSPATSPSRSPASSPSPVPEIVIPPEGDLAIGQHSFALNGVPFTIEIPTTGWTSNGRFAVDRGTFPETYVGGFILWNQPATANFADPCTRTQGPRVGPTAADLAEAVASVPGTTATGPTDVTVGGHPAKLVVVEIPDTAACDAQDFYLWGDYLGGRYATEFGSTIRVWIVDVDGRLVQLDGESMPDAPPEFGQELQQIIDSIEFE
jgi:hypothetical protein